MRLNWLKFTKFAVMALAAAGAKTAHAYNLSPISFANFYQIAAEGDLQGLKNVEHRGLNLNTTNQNGDTAVCVAIKRQDYLAYKTLIRAGAKSNPECVERIPEYAHKNFLANYNQKYAAPKTPINWTKSGTAFVVGGGIAAGVVAAAGLGGGGGGGSKGGSDDSGDTSACAMNPCAEGCYENLTCPSGYQCTQYESKCNKGCTKCEPKAECVNVPECTKGCYNELTCEEGYQCAATNKCGGCERCEKKTECQKKPCAQGCYRDLTCGEDKVCTSKNSCGGCEKCELVIPDTPDTSNARHCLVYNTATNYCDTCREGYTSVNGTCRLEKPENCSKYSYDTEKCTECEDGYKLSSDGRKCEKNGNSGDTGDTGTCDATNYPLSSCPSTASKCDSCTPEGASSPIYKIVTCNTGYQLSSDKKSCTAIPAGTCTAANYPLTSQPANAVFESCTDGSTTRYKITSCNANYQLSSDGKSCVASGSTETCSAESYPLSACPDNAYCYDCTDSSGTHYSISRCINGTNLSADNTSCEAACDTTTYPLSACPTGAVCSTCSDVNGTHNKFLKCMAGYTQDGLKEACVQEELTENSNDVINDSQLKATEAGSTTVKTTSGGTYRLGFTNYTADGKNVNSNLYNAYSKDASITVNQTDFDVNTGNLDIVGLASMYSRIPVTVNAYNNHTGTIKITTNTNNWAYGILTSGTAYNSYKGNGIINIIRNFTDSNEQNYGLVGMGVNYERLNDISGLGQSAQNGNSETTFLYNAFGGTGSIQIEATQGSVTGMRGANAINAADGGTGTIELTGYGALSGITAPKTVDTIDSIKINAYSSNNQDTVGKIILNNKNLDSVGVANAIGILSNSSPAYNAYGKGAVGYITINGAGIGMYNGNNAGNGGTGYITINTNVENQKLYSIIGIQGSELFQTNYNAVGAGSKGNINITVDKEITKSANADYTEAVYGIKDNVDNGSPDGGVGNITITDTGNNNIIGINGGGNHKDSVVTITGNADKTKSIYGMTNIALDTNKKSAAMSSFANQNYGTINITSTGSANVYGIYAKDIAAQNYGTINITITNTDISYINAYGIYTKDLAAINYGSIYMQGTGQRYGMYNASLDNSSYNYGTITFPKKTHLDSFRNFGVYNVNNGVGGKIIIKDTIDSTAGMNFGIYAKRSVDYIGEYVIYNGSASAPATSANDQEHGYIEVAGDNLSSSYGYLYKNTCSGIAFSTFNSVESEGAYSDNKVYNYGVINIKGSTSAGISKENWDKVEIFNYGYINVASFRNTSAGIKTQAGENHILNEGTISLTAATPTVANRVFFGIDNISISNYHKDTSQSTVINNGLISMDVSTADAYGILNSNSSDGEESLPKQDIVTNNGTIEITGDKSSYGIDASNSHISNNGKIIMHSSFGAVGMNGKTSSEIVNEGEIQIDGNGYGIMATNASTVYNKGSITIEGASTWSYGISVSYNSKAYNSGTITIKNGQNDTYGIYATKNSKVYNSGTITINGESYNKNEADGKFIYVDSTSSIVNEGEVSTTFLFDTAAIGGGKFVMGKNGKISAPKVKGDITADAEITSGGFDKTYANTGAFSGDTSEVKLNSGSALFDVVLKNNDIVMTMKDFDEVVDDKSLAAYLQRNYDAKRNEDLFNSLKLHATASSLNSSLNQQLGFSLIPNFAQENMNVFRSLSNLVTDNMFSQDLTNERMMVGYDYLGQDRSGKGRVTGYENTANSSYFLADTKLNNRQRFGLGVALTRFNSDYDDDSSRKATFAQVLGSYMHDFGNNWKYAGLLRAGYADGEYKRQAGRGRIEGDTSDVLYGFNNELRYNYDLGFVTLEPQFELNAYGYYQRKIKEDDSKTDSLLLDGTNNLSVESGVGLYVSKEKVYGEADGEGETGRVKARLGGSYYRELSQPYHSVRARVRDTDGYYLIESTDIFDRNRMIVRADITFNWKALEFYLRGSQFLEDKHTTVINAGIKYNF